MTHLKTLLGVAFILFCPFCISAQDALSLVVEKGQGSVRFALTEMPKVINLGNKIKVETNSASTLFDFGEVERFYYSNEMTGNKNSSLDNAKVSVYPNPCSDYIIVTCKNERASVSVTDLNGKIVTVQRLPDGFQHKLDLINLPKGSYILNIEGESLKFIKN